MLSAADKDLLKKLREQRSRTKDRLKDISVIAILTNAAARGPVSKTMFSYIDIYRFYKFLSAAPASLKLLFKSYQITYAAEDRLLDCAKIASENKLWLSSVDGPLFFDQLKEVLRQNYTNASTMAIIHWVTILCENSPVLKTQLLYRVPPKRKLLHIAVLKQLADLMGGVDFKYYVMQPLVDEIRQHKEDIIKMIGEDYCVFPSMENKDLKEADFIGVSSLSKINDYPTAALQIEYHELCRLLNGFETEIRKLEDKDEQNANTIEVQPAG